MPRPSPLLAMAFILGVFIALSAPGQTPSPGDEAAFTEGLARTQKFMARGRWKRALRDLDALLEAHAGRDYARNKRLDLVEIHRRCTFRAKNKAPDPKTLVSGRLVSHDLRTGKLKIEYERPFGDDFRKTGALFVHKAPFDGPHTITFHSDKFTSYNVLAVAGPTDHFVVRFRLQAHMGHMTIVKDEIDYHTRIKKSRCKPKHSLQIKVTKNRFAVIYNGRRIGSRPKPADQWGYWGISREVDRVVVEGNAEPSWMQGKIDSALSEAKKAFEKNYDPKKALPAWLFEKTASTKKGGGEYPDPYPVAMEKDVRERFDRATDVIADSSKTRGKRVLKKLDGQLPPTALAFLRASFGMKHRGDKASIRRDLDAVLAKKPDFAPALFLRGQIRYERGERAEGLAEVRAALAAAPRVAELYDTLAIMQLRDGRWTEARDTVEQGFKQVGRTSELAERYRAIVKAQNGPNFRVTHHYKTTNYHIVSDIDRKLCIEAGRVLEDAYRAYNVHLKWTKRAGKVKRFRVFLFSGEAGYLDFTKDVIGVSPKGSAGLFSPILKQLLIWNLPDRAAMMRTVRHEGFHQYLDRVMHDPPTWLNEGLAEYYETADYRGTGFKTGGIRDDHIRTLRRGFGDLRSFMLAQGRGFYRNPMKNYAYAWATVYTLRHGPPEYRSFFRKLFADLQEPRPTREVLLDALKRIDVKALEARIRQLVKDGALP